MSTIQNAVEAALKIRGWMTEAELRWLASSAAGKQVVIELGSWQGRSAKAMARTVGGTLFCCDPWYSNPRTEYPELSEGPDNVFLKFKENVADEIGQGKLSPMRMTSLCASREIASLLGGRPIDMVFIDADHRYESVSVDIAAWRGLIAKGGLLCGHDYSKEWPGVVKAVDELVKGVSLVNGTCIWMLVV